MPEGPPSQPHHSTRPLSTSEKFMVLNMETYHQIDNPPSNDPVIAAMWQALPFALDRSPALYETITSWVGRQEIKFGPAMPDGKPPSQVAGELRGRLQYDQLELARGLQGLHDPSKWEGSLLALARSDDRLAKFQVALHYPQNTTDGNRYGPLEIMRQIMSTPDQPRVDILDEASSILIGMKQLLSKRRYPFAVPRLLQPGDADASGHVVMGSGDPQLEEAYRALLAGPEVPGAHVSTDLFPARDPIIRKLARASLRPVSEIQNRKFMSRFHALGRLVLPPEQHTFVEADITHMDDIMAIREQFPDRKFRIAFLGTVVSQLGEDHIPQAIDAAMAALDGETYQDAAVAILDFAHPDAEDPAKLKLHPQWSSGTYALNVIYKNDPERRVRQVFRYLTSRPTEVIIGQDEIMQHGAFVGVREAILRKRRLQQP
jgi:hypothetical protein